MPCGRHILPLLLTGRPVGQGIFLISVLSCIRTATALAAVGTIVAGCAAANNATSAQASSQDEQPQKTMYGITSEGTTTSLYTEIFGPRQSAPATTMAAAQPVQPVTAQPVAPAQQVAVAGPRGSGPSQVLAPYRTQQPASAQPAQPAAVQVAQQPVSQPAPPPEPDAAAAYGLTANGPTTNLFTELFGKRTSQ